MSDNAPQLRVHIAFEGEPTASKSQRLEELNAKLGENDLTTTPHRQAAVGKGDITVWISLAGLGLSAISTLVSVLTYWRKSKPDTSPPTVTIIHAEQHVTLQADQDPATVVEQLRLDQARPGDEIKVLVTE
jgi:hypothetical protein